MKFRQNFTILDHSVDSSQALISFCKFEPQGQFLAVGDTLGDICLYQITHNQQVKCVGQFSTQNITNINKVPCKVRTMQWTNRKLQQFLLITGHDTSIKIWKLNPSHFLNSYSQFLKIPYIKKGQIIQSDAYKLNYEIPKSCYTLDLSAKQNRILFENRNEIGIWDMEACKMMFETSPSDPLHLPYARRIQNQTRVQYQQRVEAQQQYWNSIDSIVSAKFHKQNENIIGYADKLGRINIIDSRSNQIKNPAIKLVTPQGKTAVQACLNIPSDFCFLGDQNQIISRDFLYVYKWDVRKNNSHIDRLSVYPSTNTQICQLYQQAQIYNRFLLRANESGSSVFTNHFQYSFHEIQLSTRCNVRYLCQGEEICSEEVSSVHEIPPLHETKILRTLDYSENRDLVATGMGHQIKLFRAS